ncbi:unnamed protein product [Spirodela intermedia]|uniref:Coenzyme Q-binding protein COQ10 START domain-containing protein n=2 Tax=Spirodela intermedia TaxID=51605 RepID=A0A7I8KL68_SPIIN|nr:unnamed protein product [Spirodela intermedia]CAA6662153.1 unnamed protein product [Spirodela intermedia]CAA7398540.1 unnamed protein product [Spirodela intermedia]
MAAAAAAVGLVPGTGSLPQLAAARGRGAPPQRCDAIPFAGIARWSSPYSHFFGKNLPVTRTRRNAVGSFAPSRTLSPVMEWQDCSAEIEIDVPCSVAYDCYSDRELISEWMPFISSVEILKDKPDLSRWTLKYEIFGRDVEFAWLARNMQPIRNQKIHWRSLEGLPNRGAVRFYPKGPSSCRIVLTVSYEIPQILAPVASAVKPFLEGLLLRGLEAFSTFAKKYKAGVP